MDTSKNKKQVQKLQALSFPVICMKRKTSLNLSFINSFENWFFFCEKCICGFPELIWVFGIIKNFNTNKKWPFLIPTSVKSVPKKVYVTNVGQNLKRSKNKLTDLAKRARFWLSLLASFSAFFKIFFIFCWPHCSTSFIFLVLEITIYLGLPL